MTSTFLSHLVEAAQNLLAVLAFVLTLKITLFRGLWRAVVSVSAVCLSLLVLDILAAASGLPMALLVQGAAQIFGPAVVLTLLGKDLCDVERLSPGKFARLHKKAPRNRRAPKATVEAGGVSL